jgi:hypothetical protein
MFRPPFFLSGRRRAKRRSDENVVKIAYRKVLHFAIINDDDWHIYMYWKFVNKVRVDSTDFWINIKNNGNPMQYVAFMYS